MDEEHRTPGDITEQEAEHEDSVKASGEDVTMVVTEEPVGATVESKVRKNITVPEDLFDVIMGFKRKGETQSELMRRMIDSVHDLDQVKSDHAARISEAAGLHDHIAELEEEIEDLRSGAETEIIPGQQSFSIKDAMGSLKDVCDDDAVRLKFAAKLLEEQSKATNSRLEREHNAEQKRLDRADKDKDRDLKEKLASSRAEHDKDMTMIKKGMVRKEDLEDIVFLGQKNASPADRLKNQKELAARQAAHEEDETGNLDPPGEDPAYD